MVPVVCFVVLRENYTCRDRALREGESHSLFQMIEKPSISFHSNQNKRYQIEFSFSRGRKEHIVHKIEHWFLHSLDWPHIKQLWSKSVIIIEDPSANLCLSMVDFKTHKHILSKLLAWSRYCCFEVISSRQCAKTSYNRVFKNFSKNVEYSIYHLVAKNTVS